MKCFFLRATVDVYSKDIETSKSALTVERKDRQVLQTKRDNVTKESNEFKGEYGRYMATMSKKVTEGKAEHAKLTEHVSRTATIQAAITPGGLLYEKVEDTIQKLRIEPVMETNLI